MGIVGLESGGLWRGGFMRGYVYRDEVMDRIVDW